VKCVRVGVHDRLLGGPSAGGGEFLHLDRAQETDNPFLDLLV
jgi:hypothetical protein